MHARHSISSTRYPCSKARSSNGSNAIACCRERRSGNQLGPWISSAKPRFGDKIAPRFADAASITAADVARYQPFRASIATRVSDALGDGIGLLIPTAPCIALHIDAGADEIGTFYRNALTLTSIAGHAGIPQISLPAGKVAGCPVGLSVLASAGHDRALLDLGVRYADVIGMA